MGSVGELLGEGHTVRSQSHELWVAISLVHCSEVGSAQREPTGPTGGKPLLVKESLVRLLILHRRGHLICTDIGLWSAQLLARLVGWLANPSRTRMLLMVLEVLLVLMLCGEGWSVRTRGTWGDGKILAESCALRWVDLTALRIQSLLVGGGMHGMDYVALTRHLVECIVYAAFEVV